MAKIKELSRHVADLIAAGEVVERPASVVKELIENSLDAGATVITVEINAGGMTFIRVTDNGCGISPEDAKTAFLRHATSKLQDAPGLESIATLGFRGEALAAIAAVSRIELLTREEESDEGVCVTLEGGVVTDETPAGCPVGTTIVVRDLFYNTPARLKFVKSDRAESSAVAAAVLRCAMSHPEVSVRFIRDGKTEYHTPGDSRADSCVYSLLGRELAAELVPAESDGELVSVSGFVCPPHASRGNRSYQFFFVNGRWIKSKTLQAALERAYANLIAPGRYPSCVLYITLRAADVDVNVHPAKTEVKFAFEKQVFDGVYYAALGAVSPPAQIGTSGAARNDEPAAPSRGAAQDVRFVYSTRQDAPAQTAPAVQKPLSGRVVSPRGGAFKTMSADDYLEGFRPGFTTGVALDRERVTDLLVRDETMPIYETKLTRARAEKNMGLHGLPPKIVGEALGTYIIAEYENSLFFIDKHAAHERIHFDKLRSGDYEPMPQTLITPVICRFGHEGTARLEENAQLLEHLGFLVESFGDDALAVRQIPSELEITDAEPVLSEICEEAGRGAQFDSVRRDNMLKAVACKAAIKSGKNSQLPELEELAIRVLSGEVRYCPHGRPVSFELTKRFLDREFKRI